MRRLTLCAATLALATTMAGAEDITSANGMLPGCKAILATQPESYREGICAGIILTLLGISAAHTIPTKYWCTAVPQTVSVEQAARVIVLFLETHPKRLHEKFLGLALEALHEAWPCKP